MHLRFKSNKSNRRPGLDYNELLFCHNKYLASIVISSLSPGPISATESPEGLACCSPGGAPVMVERGPLQTGLRGTRQLGCLNTFEPYVLHQSIPLRSTLQ
ncbi:MAG: hypothetical protein K0Q61_1384 [Rhodococcus erythropolis]|nr:hypothetical protein [Rhodococcus erythropolis]